MLLLVIFFFCLFIVQKLESLRKRIIQWETGYNHQNKCDYPTFFLHRFKTKKKSQPWPLSKGLKQAILNAYFHLELNEVSTTNIKSC